MITDADFTKLESSDPSVKYGFVRDLLAAANDDPSGLYPYLDLFAGYLDHPNQIIRRTAIDMMGYLSATDPEKRTDVSIEKLTSFLHGGNLITCNHAIFALGLMARYKPYLKEKILDELLDVSNDTFKTGECKNIATGKVIEVLKAWPTEVIRNEKALKFVTDACGNTRNATRKKAEALARKLGLQ